MHALIIYCCTRYHPKTWWVKTVNNHISLLVVLGIKQDFSCAVVSDDWGQKTCSFTCLARVQAGIAKNSQGILDISLPKTTLHYGSFRVRVFLTWWFRDLNTYVPTQKTSGRSQHSEQYFIHRGNYKSLFRFKDRGYTHPYCWQKCLLSQTKIQYHWLIKYYGTIITHVVTVD